MEDQRGEGECLFPLVEEERIQKVLEIALITVLADGVKRSI